ncbi:MAG TPA: hypothetical protein PKI10_15805 [Syntrophorhabdus sp.]|nr:hypothetical protein [Syntrophorhabdus sp.]
MDKVNLTAFVRGQLLFTLFIISGCSGSSVDIIPGQSFKYSNDTAVVFGRLERLKDGQPSPYNTDELGSFISSDNRSPNNNIFVKLADAMAMGGFNKCGPPTGKYFIYTLRPDGYFIAVLPHGQHVINGICIKDGRWKLIPDQTPHLASFDVIPQKATYIGTIQVNQIINEIVYYKQKPSAVEAFGAGFAYGLTRDPSHLMNKQREISKDEYMKLGSNEQDDYTEEKTRNTVLNALKIRNEFEEAEKLFTSLYPDHSELIEKLVEIKQISTTKIPTGKNGR